MPIATTTATIEAQRAQRAQLERLVRARLNGALLLDAELIEETSTEFTYIVRWQNEREYGTHKALLPTESNPQYSRWVNGVLENGDYFPTGNQRLLSMQDYLDRTGYA